MTHSESVSSLVKHDSTDSRQNYNKVFKSVASGEGIRTAGSALVAYCYSLRILQAVLTHSFV